MDFYFQSIQMADPHLSLPKATFIISKHLASGSKVQMDALDRSHLEKMIPCIDSAVRSRCNLVNSMVKRLLNGNDSSPTKQHPGYLRRMMQFGLSMLMGIQVSLSLKLADSKSKEKEKEIIYMLV